MPMTQKEMVSLLKSAGWKKRKAAKAPILKWRSLVRDLSLFLMVN